MRRTDQQPLLLIEELPFQPVELSRHVGALVEIGPRQAFEANDEGSPPRHPGTDLEAHAVSAFAQRGRCADQAFASSHALSRPGVSMHATGASASSIALG